MLTIHRPPITRTEPVIEVFHGVTVVDPYRWLEDPDAARTRQWLTQQRAYARGYFDSIPRRGDVKQRVSELLQVEVVTPPYRIRDRYFFTKRGPLEEQPVITMRDGLYGHDVALVNPADRNEGLHCSASILSASRDGRLLAYGVRHSGSDAMAVEIIDVERREVLPDRLATGFYQGLVFSPDCRGFYYSHAAIDSSRPHRQAVRWHTFEQDQDQDGEVFFAGDEPDPRLWLINASDGLQMGILLRAGAEPLTDFLIQDLTAGTPPRKIVSKVRGRFYPSFSKQHFVALVDADDPNGRIVAIDTNQPEPTKWRIIVAESDIYLDGFVIAGERILAKYVENAAHRVEVFDFSGRNCGVLPCPPNGTIDLIPGTLDSSRLFYCFTSFVHPRSVFCYDTATGNQCTWACDQATLDPLSVAMEQVHYESNDGTRIPMFLLRSKNKRHSGVLPTFLTAYGGFGASITPRHTSVLSFLIEHGFLVAIANVRGGTEFGREWHLAAKRRKRQNAIDDFIAAAEWLTKQGCSSAARLAAGGGSNAALLVAAAMTQRPDLWRAAVCVGPLLDMLRYHTFDRARDWIDEFGCADNPDDFQSLFQYSPYHRVQDGAQYPSMLFVSGDQDTRCNPLHVRKMVARLQAANTSANPILLRYTDLWGHMPVQPLRNRIEALTDRLTFVCNELGVSV